MISVFSEIGIKERTERVVLEKEITALGAHEWLMRATSGEKARPRGS